MASDYVSAKIAIVDLSAGKIAIETIAINSKTCNLVGAWLLNGAEIESIKDIIGNSPILFLNENNSKEIQKLFKNNNKLVLQTFIEEARAKATLTHNTFKDYVEYCEQKYRVYMAVPPAERKLLSKVTRKNLEPVFLNNWNIQINTQFPELALRSLGKRDSIPGTPTEMKLVNTTAWLTKFLIEFWLQDEIERSGKTYLPDNLTELQLLPPSWLKGSLLG